MKLVIIYTKIVFDNECFSWMYLGYGVVIVKNGHRICGSGGCLANAPIAQNKAYFEAKLQSSGILSSFSSLLKYKIKTQYTLFIF